MRPPLYRPRRKPWQGIETALRLVILVTGVSAVWTSCTQETSALVLGIHLAVLLAACGGIGTIEIHRDGLPGGDDD